VLVLGKINWINESSNDKLKAFGMAFHGDRAPKRDICLPILQIPYVQVVGCAKVLLASYLQRFPL
jgi:uncharacterized membrane protein